ncbi:MAG: type I 3-dehydroquinate dehydratase, partial [Candidatus Peregrinibacteria bacterium]|nr:type I 3-dehydroquinate dehydratase [Candidatus Peregrinibacteria bacterium]
FETLVKKINSRADIIEIWLDQIENLDDFFESLKTYHSAPPLLATCKTPEEKGLFQGTETEKIEILKKFLNSGGNLVDLDITRNSIKNIQQIPNEKLILSFHDFNNLPTNLPKLQEKMCNINPKICKVAITANTKKDLTKFLNFIKTFPSDQPTIFTTMGKLGQKGRELIGEKSWGQFYALDKNSTTASGQKTLDNI